MTAGSIPSVSFEFFPPKSIGATFRLWDSLQSLVPFRPKFLSVTYGANGSTRDLTRDMSESIAKRMPVEVAAHLTCVGASRGEVIGVADSYFNAGIRQIVALRGDAEFSVDDFVPAEGGFPNSIELVSALARRGFEHIWVGAYPEPHPDAPYDGADIDWLRRKMDAGATGAITQFFFDPELYLRFRDKCASAGIDIPIVPGVLPIDNWETVCRFAKRCAATIPTSLEREFAMARRNGVEDILSVVVATDICATLMEEGVDHFHFYTLNRLCPTRDVCIALGLRPDEAGMPAGSDEATAPAGPGEPELAKAIG